MIKYIKFVIAFLLIAWSNTSHADESGDILDYLPAIIATTQQTCELSVLSTCTTENICTNSGGFWYSNKCNLEPKGLVLIKRLAGIWDFTHETSYVGNLKQVYRFSIDTIHSVGSQGDYVINGTDISVNWKSRSVSAKYIASSDIIYVIAPATPYISPGSGITLHHIPNYWFLDFVSPASLVGLQGISPFGSQFLPDELAWANKR